MYLLICIFNSRCTFGSSDHFCSLPTELPRLEPQQSLAPLLFMHVFLSTQKSCTCVYLVGCGTAATQPRHSLLGAAAPARGPSLRVRCYNLYSEEECSIGTATRFAWSVIKRTIAGEPTALKQDASAAADIKAAVDAGVQYIKTCFSADQCLQTAVTIIGIEPGNLLLYSPPNFF